MQPPGFVFLHGAGLGRWIWDDVASRLSASYLCLDFPHREEPRETRSGLTLADYVSIAVDTISGWEMHTVVIVAHSLGGVIGLEVAKAIGSHLAGFVAVCAPIPQPGGSFVSALPMPQRWIMPLMMRLAGTQPPASAIRNSLGTGLSEEQIQEVIRRFSAESVRVYTDRTSMQPMPDVPCLYVRTTADNDFPLALQTAMAQRLPAADVVDVAAGHLPMLSHPTEVGTILDEFQIRLSAD